MGCGASTAAVSGRYDDPTARPAFVTLPLHADVDVDAECPSEVVRLTRWCERELENQSMCSDGSEVSQPMALAVSARIFKTTVAARMLHGITGDAEQFEPEIVAPSVIHACSLIVRRWMRELDSSSADADQMPPTKTTSVAVVNPAAVKSPNAGGGGDLRSPANRDHPSTDFNASGATDDAAPHVVPSESSATNHFIATSARRDHQRSSSAGGDTFLGFDDDDDSPTLCADILALHEKVQQHHHHHHHVHVAGPLKAVPPSPHAQQQQQLKYIRVPVSAS